MTPALRTSAILTAAAALSAAALLLAQVSTPSAIAEEPPPQTQSKALSLRAQLASSHVLYGQQQAYMAVSLRAPEQEHMQRPMVDLAVVLDRSGSMDGDKLVQAKLAARHLISNLDTSDRFSLTVYGSDVEVVFPTTIASEAAKESAFSAISDIYTDGGTNLSGGLAAGQSQLLGLSDIKGRVQRVVLISDGQANEGIVNRDDLAQLAHQASMHGVSVTTVGIGLDFDEQTMTRIAVSGRGNYYFAEHADMLGELFDTELTRLGATVATQIRLRISPQEGVEIREILGYPMRRVGNDWLVNIPDMHAGETRKVIVAMGVQGSGSGKMQLTKVHADFVTPEHGELESLSQSLVAMLTKQQEVVDNHRDRDANRLIGRALTAQAIDQATELYEGGQADQAQLLMQARSQKAQELAAALDDSDFAAEMATTTKGISDSFSKAPPSSAGGKRSRKAGRNKSYKLMY